MVSSLAAQLAQNASLNSSLLSRDRKTCESYLFTGREADRHDLESILALGVNGLLQLASLNPALRAYQEALFSDAAKGVDRTLLSADSNAELDKNIAGLLRMLGPYLMEAPTGKVIEWLVRQFRINEFNVEDVLALFWPYHESPHFAKMLTIIRIKQQSAWSFLLAFKSAAQSVPRVSIVTEMLRNSDVARSIVSLLPNALKGGYTHRTLLSFNAASLHDFIVRSKSLDEGTVAFLLPAVLEPLKKHSPEASSLKDSILGSYVLLSAFSQKCHLVPKALKAIVSAMASCAHLVATHQFIHAIVSVCEPQHELESISDTTVKDVLRLSGINDELRKACLWVGIEKFVCPLLSTLGRRLDEGAAFSLVQSLVTSPNVPATITRHAITLLMKQVISAQDSAADALEARRLLFGIQQRYPRAVREIGEGLFSEGEALKDSVKQLLISLAMTCSNKSAKGPSGNGSSIDMIVASSNADPSVRKMAVDALINILATNTGLEASEKESIHSALLSRIQDTNSQVLEAIYANPPVIIPILSRHSETFLDNLAACICTKPARVLLRIHFTFLASQFCCTVEAPIQGEVFHKIFFPFLLSSKPRQRTADAVWEVIAQSEEDSGLAIFELLEGCADVWKCEKAKESANPVETMANLNLTLASKIADNILMSNNYPTHLEALLGKLGDCNAHTCLLGYLIARALLVRLSGENQVEAARRVLQAMELEHLSGIESFANALDDIATFLHDASLAKNVVVKPNSHHTVQWLQTSIIAVITGIPRPMGVVINWLANLPSDTADGKGHRFVELMRIVYKLANSTHTPSTNLLQLLFTNLKDDSLAFLGGIWTSSVDQEVRVTSLRHAAAFLEAHTSMEQCVDFQTIVPSLIVALQTLDTQGREAALACISQLVVSMEKPFSIVYGFDTMYGDSSAKLQFLNKDDYQKYIGSLVDHKEHIAADPGYTRLFHQQHLGRDKSDRKKDGEYKQRVLCYLLSHVNSISSPNVQIQLLKTLDGVSDQVKAQLLLPTIQELVQDSVSARLATRYGAHLDEFASLVVSSFDRSVASDLNEPGSSLWPAFTLSLEHYFQTGSPSSPRTILVCALERGLFASLSLERKIEVCNLLLKMGGRDTNMYQDCKKLLVDLLQDVPLMLHLLTSLQPVAISDGPRASKRAKLADSPEDPLSSLSLVAEVLGTKQLPGSLDLISRLLETLNHVVQYASSARADLSFIEQLLMLAVENAAEKITEAPNLTPSAIRLDILVDLIRVASNPQTFHQALLLMASLCRLAPDSVLHNVMPIFTFMGSNVFHRDDSYSFRVVQKTIDSIVPVVVSSFKKAHSDCLDLYIGSRDFLRIFTEAANHIPRHRRTNFFTHLVDVLGPQDLLAPILMLLIEKVAIRIVRQNAEEVQSSLILQFSILQHYSTSMQIFILTEMLKESRRLITRAQDPESLQPAFLEILHEDEHALPTPVVIKRRAHALVVFVGYAVKSLSSTVSAEPISDGGALSDLASLLIDIATAQGAPSSEKDADDIAKAARYSINRTLSVMSAADFIRAVLAMLECGEERVQAGALDLLADRLTSVSNKVRQEVAPAIERIIASTRRVISLHQEGPLAASAFKALRIVAVTTSTGQESGLVDLVPMLLSAIRQQNLASSAMAVLSPLTIKLGPRLIPYFREIVAECVIVLRRGEIDESQIVDETPSVLHGLITSIPTFWGIRELSLVLKFYVDSCAFSTTSRSPAMSTLMKAIAKRAPAKILLSTLYEMWPSSQQTDVLDCYIGYFLLLKRCLHRAPRAAVSEHLRPLFNVFLEAFDVSPTKGDKAEAHAITSFLELVVKLNEATFRPLFRRLYDWAFATEADEASKRKITFCHVYLALLDFFKGLMTPFMSFLLQPFVDILKTAVDKELWLCVIECLTKSFTVDNGVFWRNDKLRQITTILVEQVAVCIRFNNSDGKNMLPICLNALTDCVDDDALLKAINLDLLMHTRSEDPRLRLFALTCSETLWRTHGGKLIGFVAETTSFIAECAEDEHDSVVKQSYKLKNAVENVAGNINGL